MLVVLIKIISVWGVIPCDLVDRCHCLEGTHPTNCEVSCARRVCQGRSKNVILNVLLCMKAFIITLL